MTLKEARERKGMKIKFVAEHLGVTVQTVSNWEKGRTNISVAQAKRLCKLYGTTMNKIF